VKLVSRARWEHSLMPKPITSFTGNAGEHFVLAELLRRGVVAALTPRNMPDFDVLATSGPRAANIRVKTKTNAKTWLWHIPTSEQEKHPNAPWRRRVFPRLRADGEGDFTALVDLQQERARYYVVPTRDIERRLQERHKTWVTTPGRGGRQRSMTNWERRLGDPNTDREWLSEYGSESGWQALIRYLDGHADSRSETRNQ
jgi:hypothetical protein